MLQAPRLRVALKQTNALFVEHERIALCMPLEPHGSLVARLEVVYSQTPPTPAGRTLAKFVRR